MLLLGTLAAGGCAGYQVGNWALYPHDVATVYVPVFGSSSFRRNLGERLTEAVIKKIEARTPYKVVGDSGADSVLSGQIVAEGKRVLAESPYDDPRELDVSMVVQVSWLDRRAGALCPPGAVPLPPELSTVQASAILVPEVGQSVATSQQKAIDQVAEQIVGMMEAPW